jgi:hypothetical protein
MRVSKMRCFEWLRWGMLMSAMAWLRSRRRAGTCESDAASLSGIVT